MRIPLTGDNKGYAAHKFTFNFETKENGSIVPKFNKEDKKILKITNQFRFSNNKNGTIFQNKNKLININKKDSSNKIYSTKDVKCQQKEKNYSPLNTSINSIKCIDKDTPLQPVKNRKIKASLTNNKLLNDNYNTQMNNNNRCNIFETKRRLRTSRPKSEKKISPRKQSISNNKISDSNKVKKDRKKNCSSSSKRTTILPYLTENKQVIVKSKLENEVSNLFKMLPDNYYEDPEINDHMNLLIHNIAELKQCINRNKIPFKNNRNVSSKSKK